MADDFVETPNVPVSIFPVEEEYPSPTALLARAESLLDGRDDEIIVTEEELPPIGKSWALDFTKGLFVTGLRGRSPQETRGLITLAYWIEKCLRTDRGAHPVHPDGYGMVRPTDMIGKLIDDAPIEDLLPRIREALIFHPRITDVTDFTYDIESDSEAIIVSFTVVLDDETTLPVEGLNLL